MGDKAPSPVYARATADLLFGTAAVESRFQARRQLGFTSTDRGAFSLWQLEEAAIRRGLDFCKRNRHLGFWEELFDDAPVPDVETAKLALWLGADRLGCLLARVYYREVKEAIPMGVQEQARYWKKYYNTVAGKGKVEDYVKASQDVNRWLTAEIGE